jgi:hypothetical protein
MFTRTLRAACTCGFVLVSGCYLISPDVKLPRESKQSVVLRATDTSADQYIGSVQPARTIQCRDPEPLYGPGQVTTLNATDTTIRDDDEVICAVRYAEKSRNQYEKYGRVYSSVPGAVGTLLIPVSASAIALTVVGTTSWPVTALGVTAASLLGYDKIYQHPDRETLYSTGAAAVQCVIDNMQPYTTVSRSDLIALQTELDGPGGLAEAQAELQEAVQTFNVRDTAGQIPKDCTKCEGDRKFVSSVLKAADATSKAAQQTLQAGHSFIQTANGMPQTLVGQVHDINININGAIIQTETTVDALTAITKGVVPSGANNLAGIQSAAAGAGASLGAVPSTAATPAIAKVSPAGFIKEAQDANVLTELRTESLSEMSVTEKTTLTPDSKMESLMPDFRAETEELKKETVTEPKITSKGVVRKLEQNPAAAQEYDRSILQPFLAKNPEFVRKFGKEYNLPTTTLVLKQQIKPNPCKHVDPSVRVDALFVYRAAGKVEKHLNRVVSIIGSSSKPLDNSGCIALSKMAAKSKILTLNPSGDVLLSAGGKATVSILGATDPYVRPLFAQSTKAAVTGTLEKNKLEFAATPATAGGFYPFFVGDGSTGKPLNIMVTAKPGRDFDVAVCKSPTKTVCVKCPVAAPAAYDPSTAPAAVDPSAAPVPDLSCPMCGSSTVDDGTE